LLKPAIHVLVALVLLLTVTSRPAPLLAAPDFCAPGETASFSFGFAHLKELLGQTMGQPIECEHANPDNGDTLQQTSTGLSFYRKATNTPTFTDGWNHWAWTFRGLVYWTGSDIDPPGTATAAEPIESTPTTTTIDAGAPVLSVAELAAANRGAIVRVDMAESCGSGFIVNSEGYLVTNEHVVTTSNEVSVRMDGDVIVAGTVIARDATHDIALVKIASGSHPTVSIGSSDDVSLGADLTIMGHPLCSPNVTVTTGILSSRATLDGLDFIQTDATVNPGNSGGAAFDSRGALIGIPVFKFVGELIENTNFLIPMNRVRPAVDSWIEQHHAGTLAPTNPPSSEPPGLTLVYSRDEIFCANGAAGVGETVPIAQLADFVISYTVAQRGSGNTGISFRAADPNMVSAWHVIEMSEGFYFLGAPSIVIDIAYSWWDGVQWQRQTTNSGLIPRSGAYRVEIQVLGDVADVWINGEHAARMANVGRLDGGNHLGLYCANFSNAPPTLALFSNIELWSY
jgi:S1-C subfamily serine protease